MPNHRNPLAKPKCLLPKGRGWVGVNPTHRAQSTAMMRVMSSVGSPTEVSTMTMVTSPAWGMPAAPMLAAVAVMLRAGGRQGVRGEAGRTESIVGALALWRSPEFQGLGGQPHGAEVFRKATLGVLQGQGRMSLLQVL